LGHAPRPPIILSNVLGGAETARRPQERAERYLARKWDSIDTHYHLSDGHLAT